MKGGQQTSSVVHSNRLKMHSVVAFLALVAVATVAAKKHHYHINVQEKDVLVHQTGEIDIDHGTLKTTMPAHNGLDAVTTYADFINRLSVRFFPESKLCVVMELEEDWFPNPKYILDQVEYIESHIWANVPNTTFSYTRGEVMDKESLPHEIQHICGESEIYQLVRDEKLKLIDSKDLSSGKTGIVDVSYGSQETSAFADIDYCPRDFQRQMCYVESSWCGYTMECYVDRFVDGKDISVCKDHVYGEIRCCKPCCLLEVPANNPSPYCMDMPQTEKYLCSR